MGNATNLPTNYPGYTTEIPDTAATIARILRDGGYATAMFGKAHITPEWELDPSGPFDRWPTGLGFEYFYGFLAADTNQFAPNLYENTLPVTPPEDPDYLLDKDLADRAISWLTKEKPLDRTSRFSSILRPAPHIRPIMLQQSGCAFSWQV